MIAIVLAPERAAFARMRVEPGERQPRRGDSEPLSRSCATMRAVRTMRSVVRAAATSARGICTVTGTTAIASLQSIMTGCGAGSPGRAARAARYSVWPGWRKPAAYSTCLAIGFVTSAAASPRATRATARLDRLEDRGRVRRIGAARDRRRPCDQRQDRHRFREDVGRRCDIGGADRDVPVRALARARRGSRDRRGSQRGHGAFAAHPPGRQREFRTDARRIALGEDEGQGAGPRHYCVTPSWLVSTPPTFWRRFASPRVRSSSRTRSVWLRSFSPEVTATSRGAIT